MTVSKYSWQFCLFAIIALLGSYYLYERHNLSESQNVYELTTGVVTGCGSAGRGHGGAPELYFRYEVGSSSVVGSYYTSEFTKSTMRNYLIGHTFPVLWEKGWLGYQGTMLITPKNFTTYGYEFPDSLRWVLKYINR